MDKKFCRLLLGFFFFLPPTFAQAAPTPADLRSQEAIVQQQEQKILAQDAEKERDRRSKEQLFQLSKKKEHSKNIELPKESPSFVIREFKVRGDFAAKQFSWIKTYLRQYEGQKIGIQGMNLLVKEINESLVAKGYITTRVYLKEQDIASGILMLDLQPGTIGAIRFADPHTWGTWKNAFSVRKGDLLNIRDLEQGLEQMKRVPSQEVDIKIVPAQTPGQSDIVLSVKRSKPWKIVTSLDDSGLKSTGKLQATTALEIDNFFSMNDILNISLNEDAEKHGQQRGTRASSLYYSIPFGKDTLTFSTSTYNYHQLVTTAVNPFLSSGNMDNYDFGITHLLQRDQTRKTNMELHIIKKHRHSYIDDEEITVQRQDTTAVQLGITHKQYIGQSTLDAALRYQQGVRWLGAKAGPTDGMPDEPTTQYGMFLFDLTWNTPLKMGAKTGQYNFMFRTQQTSDHLYGSEFFSIGGRYSVRGFDGEQNLSAENGFLIRNEWRYPFNQEHQLYAAMDYGKVSGPSAQFLTGTELMGAAIGLRGNIKNTQYDVFVGWPIEKPDGFKTAAQTYGFQLTMQI